MRQPQRMKNCRFRGFCAERCSENPAKCRVFSFVAPRKVPFGRALQLASLVGAGSLSVSAAPETQYDDVIDRHPHLEGLPCRFM